MRNSRILTALAAAACIALETVTAAQPVQTSSPQIPQLQGPAQPRPSAPGPGAPTPGPGAPPRDPVKAPTTGNAILRGRAVALDNGTPLRRVIIRLMGGALRIPRTALTDGEGRYELKDVPAGRYRLSANKSGFVTVLYGQRGPLDPDRPIEIREGETRDKADFALPRGGVITGRITDEYGDPAAETSVQAMAFRRIGGRRRLTPMGQATTNDLGQYRIYGLPPGEYYIAASATGSASPSEVVTDNASGTGYLPTYFPGTPSAADALRVTLEVGAEASADLQLLPTRVVTITGSVVDEQGQPVASAFVGLQVRDPDLASGGVSMNHITGVDGAFTVSNVAPGSYHLTASVQNRNNVPGGPRIGGSVPIVVTGHDMDGVRIVASRGGTIKGRVIYEGDKPPAGTSIPTTMRVTCQVAPGEGPMMMGSVPKPIDDAGQFEVIGIHSPCHIRVLGTPADWTVKAVLHESRDIVDRPVTLSGSETLSGVQVILTNRVTTLTGGVADANHRPTRDYVVVVHPEDVEKVGPLSRYVRIARADQDGQFKVTGLPPGDYLAAAVDVIEEGAEQDPEFLERIRASSVRVQLSETAPQSLTLKLSTPQNQ
jgi:Carboxypeptidase regulatory-like domain